MLTVCCSAPQKYITVHTSHGTVTLAFEDSADAQMWFAALKDVVANLKQVLPVCFRAIILLRMSLPLPQQYKNQPILGGPAVCDKAGCTGLTAHCTA